jgi:uncharacterized protein
MTGDRQSRRIACSIFFPLLVWFVSFVGAFAPILRARATTQDARRELSRTIVVAAIEQTHHAVRYDPSYVRIPYPGGDVPADTGVCTDVVIRAYRAAGIDLQKEVHQDMAQNFSAYPHRWQWRRSSPDPNIDHRRVPNLMMFFARKGLTVSASSRAEDFAPGDLVAWDLGGGVLHIGIVTNQEFEQTSRRMVVHNIGQGPKLEDVLFTWEIVGHYRYFGPERSSSPGGVVFRSGSCRSLNNSTDLRKIQRGASRLEEKKDTAPGGCARNHAGSIRSPRTSELAADLLLLSVGVGSKNNYTGEKTMAAKKSKGLKKSKKMKKVTNLKTYMKLDA